jgi:uncharacterized protein (UPF0332 family)
LSPEQEALARKARESLLAARILLGHGLHNIAVSRAYYAIHSSLSAEQTGEQIARAQKFIDILALPGP